MRKCIAAALLGALALLLTVCGVKDDGDGQWIHIVKDTIQTITTYAYV